MWTLTLVLIAILIVLIINVILYNKKSKEVTMLRAALRLNNAYIDQLREELRLKG